MKYKEALERTKLSRLQLLDIGEEATNIEYIFPELKESEDEKIRKELLAFLKENLETGGRAEDTWDITRLKKWIAWLEKPGEKTNPYSGISFEYNGHTWGMCARDYGVDISLDGQLFKHIIGQKPADVEEPNFLDDFRKSDTEDDSNNKVEPKFKVGDWVVGEEYTCKVVDIRGRFYKLSLQDGQTVNIDIPYADEKYRLWTVEDAKDGDVLANKCGAIFIYAKNTDEHRATVDCYYYISVQGEFYIEDHKNW